MNSFALRCSFLAAAIIGAVWPFNIVQAQETQRQKQEQTGQQNQYRDQEQSLQQDQVQRSIQAYRGQISSKHGNYYLEDKHSRTSYLLMDTWQVKKLLNRKVRVTGWLEPDKEILHVVSVATIP